MTFFVASLAHYQEYKKPDAGWSIAQKVTGVVDGFLEASLIVVVVLAALDQSGAILGCLQGIGAMGPGVWAVGGVIVAIALADVAIVLYMKKMQQKERQQKEVEGSTKKEPQQKKTADQKITEAQKKTAHQLKKTADPEKTDSSTSKDSTAQKVEKTAAILFASISANPAHYGHLAAAATAAKEVSKENKVKILFSICPQSYLVSKMKDKQAKIPTFEERQHQLETLLNDAKAHGMFPDMEVEFWNDQANGFSDHPDSYANLVKKYQGVAKVIFVAGSDLCRRMNNWRQSIGHAVVVSRGEGDPESYAVKDNDGNIVSFNDTKTRGAFVKTQKDHQFSRILLDSAYPQFTSLSSTAIREGKMANTFV